MPSYTTYLSLALYNATTDQSVAFSAYRAAQAGTSGSNMILIDSAIGQLQTDIISLQALRGINSVDFAYDSPGLFIGTNAAITAYENDMTIALTLDQDSDGATDVDINSLGAVTLKKIVSAAKADIEAGDLLEAQIYLFLYDGVDFVWAGRPIVTISGGTEDNLVSIAADGTLQDSGFAAADFQPTVGAATEDNIATFDASGLVQDGGSAISDLIAKSTLTAKGSLITASAASIPAELGVGSNGEKLVSDSGATNGINWMDDDYNISVILGDGTNVITTGIKGSVPVPVTGEIESVEVVSHTSGSIVVDIWEDTYANFPPTDADSITASAPPTLSSSTKSQDSTLTGWTKTVTKGSYLTFNVDSATTVTQVTLTLYIRKTAVE